MTEQVINALWTQGVLFDLDIGKSQFNKKNRSQDMGLNEDVDPDAMSTGSKKLMPPRVIKKLLAIENLARATLKNRSLEFPLSGARFVYYKALGDLTKMLEVIREDWNLAVLDITSNYEGLKQEQIKLLDFEAQKISKARPGTDAEKEEWLIEQYTHNRNIFPPLASVQDRFRFGWRMYKVNAADGLSTMGEVEKEAMLDAQKKLQQEMQAWAKDASSAIHKKLGEAAAQASAMLSKQGKLNPKNLKPLFDAFEEFKAVDFTGSSDFRNKIDKLTAKFLVVNTDGKTDMATTADSINNTSTGLTQFKEVLEDLSELAVDAVAEQAGLHSLHKVGEFKRMVEID